jgi:hypothetical protein
MELFGLACHRALGEHRWHETEGKGTAASCRAFQDGDDLLRISNRLAPASARFCRLRCSGGCSFAFLCLDGGGPWPEGINGLARNPAYLFLVCQLFGCLDPAFGER